MSKRDCWKWVRKVAAPNSRSPSRAATLPTRLLSKTWCLSGSRIWSNGEKKTYEKMWKPLKINLMILILNGIEWVSGEASSAKLRGVGSQLAVFTHWWPKMRRYISWPMQWKKDMSIVWVGTPRNRLVRPKKMRLAEPSFFHVFSKFPGGRFLAFRKICIDLLLLKHCRISTRNANLSTQGGLKT